MAGQLGAAHDAVAGRTGILLQKESRIPARESLANLLEAAGALALERTGTILDERFPEE